MRAPTDTPLKSFVVTMTADDQTALLLEKLEEDRLDALRLGVATLHDFTNCAHGTRGYVIHSLRMDGLMSCDPEFTPRGTFWHYAITQKGTDYLIAAGARPDDPSSSASPLSEHNTCDVRRAVP